MDEPSQALREHLQRYIEALEKDGFSVEIKDDSVYIRAAGRDAILADLPLEFLEEVIKSGLREIVLVVGERYYYYRAGEVKKLLGLRKKAQK